EGGDAGTPGAHALGEGALRGELDGEFTGEVLAGVLPVGAEGGADRLGDAPVGQEASEAEAVGAEVVGHDSEVGGALLAEGVDETGGDADQSESADGDGRSVGDVGDGRIS